MRLNQIIHFLHVEQLLRLNLPLPNIIGIYGDEMGFADFKTRLFTYKLLKGDIEEVMVFAGSG